MAGDGQKEKTECVHTDTLPWHFRLGLSLLYAYLLCRKYTKIEKKMLENKNHSQSYHTEKTINIWGYFLLLMLYFPKGISLRDCTAHLHLRKTLLN